MSVLKDLPTEIFDIVIDDLVTMIGLQNAILLRPVDRAFDEVITQALCNRQVSDIHDPRTPYLARSIKPPMKGRIINGKASRAEYSDRTYVQVVADVNRALDSLIDDNDDDEEGTKNRRHELIAGAVLLKEDPVDALLKAQNVLCGAGMVGNLDVMQKLLGDSDHRPDVNGSTPYFHSPLTLAALHGHTAVVQHLLASSARLDSVSDSWYTYDGRISEQDDWNRTEGYIRRMALSHSNPSALRASIRSGHENIMEFLLRPEYRLPITSLEYLRAARDGVKIGRLDLVDTLFKKIGKDISDFNGLDEMLLWTAIRYDQKHVVQMLLDNGVDVNAFPEPIMGQDNGTLQIAASLANISMIRFLLERGARVDVKGRSLFQLLPIKEAAKRGHLEVVKLFIEECDDDPLLAFRAAAHKSPPRIVEYLIRKFPDLLVREDGDTAKFALL